MKFLTCSIVVTKQISRNLQVAPRTDRKIICHFQRYGTLSAFSHGGNEPRKVTEVLQCVEIWKLQTNTASGFHVQIITSLLHS